jgi:hypothetical protein
MVPAVVPLGSARMRAILAGLETLLPAENDAVYVTARTGLCNCCSRRIRTGTCGCSGTCESRRTRGHGKGEAQDRSGDTSAHRKPPNVLLTWKCYGT